MELHFCNDNRIKLCEIPSFKNEELKEFLNVGNPYYVKAVIYVKEKKKSLNIGTKGKPCILVRRRQSNCLLDKTCMAVVGLAEEN